VAATPFDGPSLGPAKTALTSRSAGHDKRGTEIAGHVETAAQPGIAEARAELDATAAKDEDQACFAVAALSRSSSGRLSRLR